MRRKFTYRCWMLVAVAAFTGCVADDPRQGAEAATSAETVATLTPGDACNPGSPPSPLPVPITFRNPPPPPTSVGVLVGPEGSIPAHSLNSPLVFNFCGRPISYLGHGVPFDLYGNGTQPLLDWIGPSFALLALPNSAGQIISGSQLFGTETPLSCGRLANDGFLALAQYDSNQDGAITLADPVFKQLVLWFDLNSDGVAQASEQLTLGQSGVESISLSYTPQNPPDADVSYVGYTGTFSSVYGTGQIADVYFPASTPAPATPAHGACGAYVSQSPNCTGGAWYITPSTYESLCQEYGQVYGETDCFSYAVGSGTAKACYLAQYVDHGNCGVEECLLAAQAALKAVGAM